MLVCKVDLMNLSLIRFLQQILMRTLRVFSISDPWGCSSGWIRTIFGGDEDPFTSYLGVQGRIFQPALTFGGRQLDGGAISGAHQEA